MPTRQAVPKWMRIPKSTLSIADAEGEENIPQEKQQQEQPPELQHRNTVVDVATLARMTAAHHRTARVATARNKVTGPKSAASRQRRATLSLEQPTLWKT